MNAELGREGCVNLKDEKTLPYFYTGVDGTDEEDVGEDDEDADEQSDHERRAAKGHMRDDLCYW